MKNPTVCYNGVNSISLLMFFFSVQLKIQDVHLRFEDGVTNPSQPFAFGICIKNVSMQNAVFEPVSATCVYKSSSDGMLHFMGASKYSKKTIQYFKNLLVVIIN